jgi:hypothetical protein
MAAMPHSNPYRAALKALLTKATTVAAFSELCMAVMIARLNL